VVQVSATRLALLTAVSMHVGAAVLPLCTLAYAPPEVVKSLDGPRSDVVADPAHDVWSLGAIAFEAFTRVSIVSVFMSGRQKCSDMAHGKDVYPWEQAQMEGDYRDSRVRSVVEACLSRDPAKRPSAAEVCSEIRQFSI
jgi:serine/threonine protein kinase